MSKAQVTIYTDGACSGNPGPGGWGALLIFGEMSKEINGFELHTTNNQMEMQAAIEALQILKKPCIVDLYTDSKYLQQGITKWIHQWQANNWRKSDKQPVKNIDRWQKLQLLLTKHDIIWHWVKGHSENQGNQIADRLAVTASLTAKKQLDASNL